MSALSYVFMKVAHNKIAKTKKSVYFTHQWMIGFLTLIAGSIINVVALAYGNQLLLSSSSSITIIWNTIFSVIFLKEALYKTDIVAILFICLGSTLFLSQATNDGSEQTKVMDQEGLLLLYMDVQSIVFITVSIVFIVYSFKIDVDSKKELFEYAEKNTFDV